MKRKTLVLVPVVILTIAIGSVAVNACSFGGQGGFNSNFFGGLTNKSSFNSNIGTKSKVNTNCNTQANVNNQTNINSKVNANSNTQANVNSQTNIDIKGQIENIKKQFQNFQDSAGISGEVNGKGNEEKKTAQIIAGTTDKISGDNIKITSKEDTANSGKEGSTAPETTVKAADAGKDGGSVVQTVPAKKVAAVATTVDNTVKQESAIVDNSVKAESIVVDNTVKADVAATDDLPKAGESNPFSYLMIGLALVAIGIAVLYYRKRNTVSSWNR